jgi:hypothetical protein
MTTRIDSESICVIAHLISHNIEKGRTSKEGVSCFLSAWEYAIALLGLEVDDLDEPEPELEFAKSVVVALRGLARELRERVPGLPDFTGLYD